MRYETRAPLSLLSAAAAFFSCALKEPEVVSPDTSPLAVSSSREVTLHYVRFDVTGFSKRLTKADLLALPADTRRRLWLFDLDIIGASGSPLLIDNALAAIRALNPNDPLLGTAERNMVRLLQMTPDTARLQGTSIEEILRIAPRTGLAPAQVLADSLGINPEDPILPLASAREAIVDRLVRSHPNALTRLGPKTATNPTGVYSVARGFLPVTLDDCVSDFRTLSETFGPYAKDGVYHPGFVVGQVASAILQPDFALTIKANPNALPFKGVDGTFAAVANVNSIGNDRRPLFDFADSSWLVIEGLLDGPLKIDRLTFQITESTIFNRAGTSPLPAPYGNGSAWQEAPYTFERVVLDGASRQYGARNYSRDYTFGGNPTPLVKMRIVNGYFTVETAADLGNPPAPLYLADMLLEAAQTRLHDGPDPNAPDAGRIPEGQATLRFNLTGIDIGANKDKIHESIKANIVADPTSLINVAAQLFDNGSGAPDFFYVRAESETAPAQRGDWLFFVSADDMGKDSAGTPKRDYARYARVGFFSDSALTNKVSDKTSVGGDSTREKFRIDPADATRNRIYYQDDDGALFEVLAANKPDDRHVTLRITRLR